MMFFQLFQNKVFKKSEEVSVPKNIHWFWRFIGFSREYQLQVLEDPKQVGGDWEYPVKAISYKTKWLGMTLKTVKL